MATTTSVPIVSFVMISMVTGVSFGFVFVATSHFISHFAMSNFTKFTISAFSAIVAILASSFAFARFTCTFRATTMYSLILRFAFIRYKCRERQN